MYHHNFIIGQVIVAANEPVEIDEYVCKDNEVKLFTCMYDLQTGEFLGLKCEVAFIVLTGDDRELSLSYGFNTNTDKALFYIHLQNKKYLTLLFQYHFKNITARL